MTAKLTPEQIDALNTHPGQAVPVQDEQGKKVYYIIEESSLRHLQGLAAEQSQSSHERLKAFIEEGIESPHIPAIEAHARLRRKAAELSQADA